jgi:hypothetical protein
MVFFGVLNHSAIFPAALRLTESLIALSYADGSFMMMR